jgi:hypothetical protein
MAGKGSPPGVRRGGRQKGSLNHATLARQSAILASGLSPLDYLVSVYRDEEQAVNVRVDAAKAVAGYCYPKLQALDLGSREGQPITVQVIRFSDLPNEATPGEL